MMLEVSKEIEEFHAFETKSLCVIIGFVRKDDEQLAKVVKKEEEGARVSQRYIEENRSQSILIEEE